MESSVSCMKKLPSSSHEIERTTVENDDEQSTWTFYIEDFKYDDKVISGLQSDDSESPSFVSNTASLVTKKSFHKSNCRNLSFKRQKTRKVWVDFDDDLEDTASSPKTSPKEKASLSGQIDEKSFDLHFGGRDNSYTELNKRGLCLVPVSMVENFITN